MMFKALIRIARRYGIKRRYKYIYGNLFYAAFKFFTLPPVSVSARYLTTAFLEWGIN